MSARANPRAADHGFRILSRLYDLLSAEVNSMAEWRREIIRPTYGPSARIKSDSCMNFAKSLFNPSDGEIDDARLDGIRAIYLKKQKPTRRI